MVNPALTGGFRRGDTPASGSRTFYTGREPLTFTLVGMCAYVCESFQAAAAGDFQTSEPLQSDGVAHNYPQRAARLANCDFG